MAKAQSFLMIPDSIRDRILLFNPTDGSLIDDNFIDGSIATGLGIFRTPINAIQVDREIWVSDQVADAIFRFDLGGNYLGIVNDANNDGTPDGLDNIRGIEFANGLVYVSNSGTNNGAPGDGEVVVVFDAAGNNLGFFDTGNPYDIRAYNGSLLISDINSESSGGEDIDRYTLDGIDSRFDGTFVESDGVTGIDFSQQITVRQSNANLLVSGFSAPGGIYEYDAAGNQVDLLNAEDGFADRLRAAYELANGNIIWSGGDGVIVTDPTTGEDTEIYTVNTLDFRPSARYIEQLIVPNTGQPDLTGAVFLGDQGLDKIFLTQDLNGDGDANDPLEVSVYFDETNAAGLIDPTRNVFTIFQSSSGAVFYGDGIADSVYRLVDRNQDGDALDEGEATVWFTDSSETPLPTPNGIAQGRDRAIYIVNAGVRSRPADVVYRTQDLNGDGDALDSGESSVWLDLSTLNPSSSAFDIEFIGDTAYISDTVGGDDDVIYRAEDLDGSGTVDASEVTVFIQDGAFGVPLGFGIAADDDSIYTWESLDFSGPNSVYRLSDQDGSGDINAANEATEVWNTDALPAGFATFSNFSIAVGPDNELTLTSNGRESEDNLFRLVDTNGDGDYFDAGETIPYLAASVAGTVPERARAVEYAQTISEDAFFFSSNRDTANVGDTEDIVQFDGDSFNIFFDGSSLGLSNANIDAFDIISDTVILMSFDQAFHLDGLGVVDDSDVVKFTATSLGEGDTAGSFELFLDGSDLGLTQNRENIDALTLMSDGSLLLSTQGNARLSNGLASRDEDLVRYDPISGQVSLYFDGSDVGLGSRGERTDAVTMRGDELLLSTEGTFNLSGQRGRNEDVLSFTPTSLGTTTAGSFDSDLFFDGSQSGFTENLIAIDLSIG
ncbi:MAG: hypothetical protein AAGA46_08580 [Cyanobacteria bacterium P01_F01_bin.13]